MSFTSFSFLFYKQEPTHRKVGNKPHPIPRGFLSRVGPTCSNSRQIIPPRFFFTFSLQLSTKWSITILWLLVECRDIAKWRYCKQTKKTRLSLSWCSYNQGLTSFPLSKYCCSNTRWYHRHVLDRFEATLKKIHRTMIWWTLFSCVLEM